MREVAALVNLIYCELLKLKRSKMLLISFLGALVTPIMMIVDGIRTHYAHPEIVNTLADLYDSCLFYTMIIFGLLVYTVIAAYLFSREYSEKTLKTVLTVPVPKLSLIASKFNMLFIWIIALTLVSWVSTFILAATYNVIFGIAEFSMTVALRYLGKMLLGGVLMFLTLSPFAFLAEWTKGIVVPVIVAATVLMGNAALSNEALGALFPWTATLLLINGKITGIGYLNTFAISLIALVSILGFLASVIYFQKEDIK
jgi:bacitracin transport system permease protein